MASTSRGQPAPDIAELYTSLAGRLERIVRVGVRAPDAVIEDACQFAWSRLVLHRANVRTEAVLSWLSRTAMREAVRLVKRESREASLDCLLDALADPPVAPASDPYELMQTRERLALLRLLPERQQRLLWLHGVGLSYAEMASHERCTRRTVERQLLRAKRSIRNRCSG